MILRLTATVVGLLSVVGCSTPDTMISHAPSCRQIESEITRVYALTTLGEAPWDAWQELYGLLETAQLRACEVKTETPQTPMRGEQLTRFRIGGKELECIKPSGVRVYTAIRDLSKYPGDTSTQPYLPDLLKLRQVQIFSYPPKGPTILIDKMVAELPDIVQAFLYERACEAHRQGARLQPQSGLGYEQSGEYNCAAIKRLKKTGLTRAQLAVILEYARTNQFGPYAFFARNGRESIQWEEMFNACYQFEEFSL